MASAWCRGTAGSSADHTDLPSAQGQLLVETAWSRLTEIKKHVDHGPILVILTGALKTALMKDWLL